MWLFFVLLLASTHLWAASIQYVLATGVVTGVSDDALADVPDHGVVVIPEPVAAIVWPLPAGCTAGQPKWTMIVDPLLVTAAGGGMAPRTDILWFSSTSNLLTNCHVVSTWPELRQLVERTIVEKVHENDLVISMNVLNVITQVRCPGATGGATCDSARASMTSLNSVYPTAAQLNNFLGSVVTLRDDATAFRAAQCPTNPGFCP